MSEIDHWAFVRDAPFGVRFTKGDHKGKTGWLLGPGSCYLLDAQVDGTGTCTMVDVCDYVALSEQERAAVDQALASADDATRPAP